MQRRRSGAGPAQAAIPASGIVVEGIGPSIGRIGTPGAALAARLGLVCRPASVGGAAKRCYTSLSSALKLRRGRGLRQDRGLVVLDRRLNDAAWRRPRIVYCGRAGRVRGAPRRSRHPRLDLHETTANGRRAARDVLPRSHQDGRRGAACVWREHRQILRPVVALTPAGRDLSIRLIDVAPKETWKVDVNAPWQEYATLPPVRTDARGNAGVVLPRRTGVPAQILATRPAGTSSPVTLTFRVQGIERAAIATAQVALAPLPTLSYSLPVMSEATPGTVTVVGMEASAAYGVSAEWVCPNGVTRRTDDAGIDPVSATRGPDQTVGVNAVEIHAEVFSPACVTGTAPTTVPVTLVLSRPSRTTSERVAQITVPLSGPSP